MEPLARSRSSTFSMSNWAYFASRTPSATFSKSQKTARLRASGLAGMSLRFGLLFPVEPALEAFEVEVDHRRDVERQELREQQPAHHREAEGHAGAAAGAEADRNGEAPHQRRHGGHHDRAEADESRLVDGLLRRHAVLSLRLDREVDHHDRVLLHDADQHDDADE